MQDLVSTDPDLAPAPRAARPLGMLLLVWLLVVPGIALGTARGAARLFDWKAVNEHEARASMRSIVGAQAWFQATDPDHDGVHDYAASLEELRAACEAEGGPYPELGPWNGPTADEVSGYRFVVSRDVDAPCDLWCARADPITPGFDGDSAFWVSESGWTSTHTAPAPPLDPAVHFPGAGWHIDR